jgi:hypothetical protein
VKIAEAFVEVRADTAGFAPAVEKEAKTAAERARSSFKNLFAGVAVGAFLKGSFDEIQEAEKSAKQLEQTIRSTGGAAQVTAKNASDLADQISRASTVDDELVANTERILLTFTNIKNSGADKTFDRATQAAIDLAAALGTDAQGAAIQLGKALNDPLKGITALQRAGVSFTASQKEQIKALVDSGNAAKAQGIILSEVEKEFGGQAAAAATDADKAKVAFANLEESVGRALLPVLNDAAKAVTVLSDAFQAQPTALQQVELGALAAGIAYAKLKQPVGDALSALKQFRTESTGLKGALGSAGIAGAITLAAVAASNFARNWQASRFRDVKGSLDDITLSLQKQAAGTKAVDLKGVTDDFKTLDSTATRFAANRLFSGTFWGDSAAGQVKAAQQDLDQLDKGLANLVQLGQQNTAAKAFRDISASLKDAGFSTSDIKKRFDDYTDALKHNQVEAGGAAGKTDDLKTSADKTKDAIDGLKNAVDKYTGSMQTLGGAEDTFQSTVNTLPEVAKAVREAGGDFGGTSDAAIAFRNAQRDLIGQAGDVIKAMDDQGASADAVKQKRKQLADEYYIEAIAAGVPKQAAEDLRRAILNIPTKHHIDFSVNSTEAEQAIGRLRQAFNGLPGPLQAQVIRANALASGGPMQDGWTWVGEQGPELAHKSGSQVDIISNQQSRSLLSTDGGGGYHVHLHLSGFAIGSEEQLGRKLVDVLNSHQKRYGR